MDDIEIDIELDYESLFLPCYHHLLNDNIKFLSRFFDIEFLYGGRDSGKSRHIAMQLVIDCITQDYFRCIMIRKVLNTVRASQFSLIKGVIKRWQLEDLFVINDGRMEIIFKANGNGFYARGLDNVDNIKSFDNPSCCWVEEGHQIEKDDFVVILTSLRAEQRVKTYFSFNPECEENYLEFWLYDEYFSHSTAYNWEWKKTITLKHEDTGVEEVVEFHIRATHTTYKDNPYCKPQRKALYESYKNSKNNAYWYQTYTLGLWGYKRTGSEFWKCFNEQANTTTKGYMNTLPVHVVVDNNYNPYIAVQLWQIEMDKKILRQIGELPCTSPNNTASKAALRVAMWLDEHDHKDLVFLYGDPSANAKSTNDDSGRSFFEKFIAKLQAGYKKLINRVAKCAPRVALSGSFVNEIYESNYEGWTIEINVDCRVSIEDYVMAKEDMNGGILKKRIMDPDTKVTYEKYGHFSDNKRYFVTAVLNAAFEKYKAGTEKYFGI